MNDAEMGSIQCGTEENCRVLRAGLCGFVTLSACFSMVINTTGHAKISIRIAVKTLMDTLCMLPHQQAISQQGKAKFKSPSKKKGRVDKFQKSGTFAGFLI